MSCHVEFLQFLHFGKFTLVSCLGIPKQTAAEHRTGRPKKKKDPTPLQASSQEEMPLKQVGFAGPMLASRA